MADCCECAQGARTAPLRQQNSQSPLQNQSLLSKLTSKQEGKRKDPAGAQIKTCREWAEKQVGGANAGVLQSGSPAKLEFFSQGFFFPLGASAKLHLCQLDVPYNVGICSGREFRGACLVQLPT